MKIYSDFALILILLVFSGVFSASETALLSFKNLDLQNISSKSIRDLLESWLKNSNGILSTILIANNSINILLSALTTAIVAKNYDNAVFVSTFVVTVAILIFGEITPKLIAKNYSLGISKIVISPLTFLSKILYPFIFLLTQISKFIGRILGLSIIDKDISTVTENDIRSIISMGNKDGIIEEDRREMLDGILNFSDLTVSDLLVPRQDVFMLQASKRVSEVIDEILEKGFSRIPLYEDSFDNIIGALYVKDIVAVLKNGRVDIAVKDIMRDINFVPETKNAFSLLKEFKDQKVHIAVVVDEYGGTVGMITIEDILEEIVGDIKDEFDKIEVDIKKLEDNKFLVKGSLDIEEINKRTSLNIPENIEYESLGGFVNYISGTLPNKGEVIEWNNLEIIVKDVDNHAVKYAIVTKSVVEEESETDTED